MKIKVCCVLCKSEISVNNLKAHYGSKTCSTGGKQIINHRDNLNCCFCGKPHVSLKSVVSHENKII